MSDALFNLKDMLREEEARSPGHWTVDRLKAGIAEIERLRLWIRRIDNINDDPARFSTEIDRACADALAGKSMTGRIDAAQQSPQEKS